MEQRRDYHAFCNFVNKTMNPGQNQETERLDFMYDVYIKLRELFPDLTENPFPQGLGREVFSNYPVHILAGSGGTFQGPNIEQVIRKVSLAFFETAREAYERRK